jgi:hypothetical protein
MEIPDHPDQIVCAACGPLIWAWIARRNRWTAFVAIHTEPDDVEPDDGLRPHLARLRQLLRVDARRAPEAHGPAALPAYQRDGDPRTSGPGFGLTLHHDKIGEPLRWRKPRVVFVNSMSTCSTRTCPTASSTACSRRWVSRRAHLPGAHEAAEADAETARRPPLA